ncbi:nitroreductase family protein [Oxalobacter paraformigenes]|uniref:Nitroreductase domain-containing protein n=1 Tax=Oxalobacter paraformigenes TaxID=556268 RepID=C3X2G0_9BURK|nr:nitroreductase family protein [Oxalobacter paraformigenes]EEO27396.1 hypothetical protein OFAG_00549 [Oxalobacter paraformigenes]
MSTIESSPIDTVIASRQSIRAYKKDPVPAGLIEHVLDMASRAPSATNMQPWKVYVLTGNALKRLTDAVCTAFDNEPEKHQPEYSYYPDPPFEPYLSRRRKVGQDMYSLIGIAREDHVKRHQQQRRNFEFFGAPAGFIFTIDRKLPCVNFIDYGAFFENLMLSAKSHGLDTCLQAFWSDYHLIIREQLSLPAEEMVLAGMAIGYAATDAPINRLATDREPVSAFATFLDK